MIKIENKDFLEFLKDVEDNSVDLILIDPPFNTTPCSWDKKINLKGMWKEFKRIAKPTTPILICSQQPFTSILICSNLDGYKYNWVWEKDNGTNFLNSHYQPLKVTEDICVFGDLGCSWNKRGNLTYNPQFEKGKPYICVSGKQKSDSAVVRGGKGGRAEIHGHKTESDGKRYPKNLIKFNRDKDKLHPTQKPKELIKYLVKTYSKENDLVLDCFLGSGTTALACKELNRNFIGCEISKEHYKQSLKRLNQEVLL